MSTKKLREVLKWARNNAPETLERDVADALAEVDAIERAAKALEGIGGASLDYVERLSAREVFRSIAKDAP